MREGPAAEAEALEFDKIDLDLGLARSCPARGPADLKASASAAGPLALRCLGKQGLKQGWWQNDMI